MGADAPKSPHSGTGSGSPKSASKKGSVFAKGKEKVLDQVNIPVAAPVLSSVRACVRAGGRAV
jgi:hypothetical protein